MIDTTLAGGTKSGYAFAYAVVAGGAGPNIGYTISATPSVQNQSGVRGFFSDQSGVIRADSTGKATVVSTPL